MNLKNIFRIGLLGIVVLLLGACVVVRGSGSLITESRAVGNFERVDLSGSGKVLITQGEEESLTVETDDNVMRYIRTNVRNRTLHLSTDMRQLSIVSPTRLRFTLQVKDLTGLDLSGSGSIVAERVVADRFDMNLSGSGSMRIDELTADQLNVDVSGSSNVQVGGETTRANIDISGSGDVAVDNLRSDAVDVQVSGSGTATVWAIETLDLDLSGSGAVSYYGQPSLNSSTSGSGTINNLGSK